MDAQELSEATLLLKKKQWQVLKCKIYSFRSSTKIRGDDTLIQHLFKLITTILKIMMVIKLLVAANPDWFASTYGKINQDASII